jgi:2-polyprenyl-6-methoxyphenol hydroxylase-like FAD-dependent oxidoreductase
MHVVVIGAGLGGLALAQGLRRAGIDVTVYERDSGLASRRQGYRLHIDPDAHDALAEVLPPRLVRLFHRTAGTPNARFTALDDQLNQVATVDAETVDFAVDRLVLRQILLAGIEDAVVFGKEFERFEGQTAHFTDGTSVCPDVLVAADGVNSAVRRQYLPHARIVDTGVWQLYGTVPLTERTRPLFDDRMRGIFTVISGPERTFLGVAPVEFPVPPRQAAAEAGIELLPVSDYMTCSFGARREWFGTHDLRSMPGEQLHGIVTEAVRTWHPRVREIVAACDPATLFALPLRQSVPIDPWPTTTVTLLGDAIHAMSPAAGAGACVALRDASLLTAALTRGGNLVDALRDYESAMTERGFAAVREGAANGHRFLGQDPLPDERHEYLGS